MINQLGGILRFFSGKPASKACLLLAGSALAFSSASPALAEEINGVDFGVVYQGGILPADSTPAWVYASAGGSVQTPDPVEGTLQLTTTKSGGGYYTSGAGVWDGNFSEEKPGSTVEFSMKVVSQAEGADIAAASLHFSTSSMRFILNITSDKIYLSNTVSDTNSYLLDTTDAFHTIRLTLAGDGSGVVSVYVDNNPTAVLSGYMGQSSGANNTLWWGDNSASVGGTTQWKYLAFTNEGAFAPVPEPRPIAAGLIGAAFIAWNLCAKSGASGTKKR